MRELNEAGENLIKEFEGLYLNAYQDAVGVWTIGWGHTGSDVYPELEITLDRAEELFKADMEESERAVDGLVRVVITDNQFGALVSFTFNCGIHALEKSTLLRLLNLGKMEEAANEFPRWNRAGGKVLAGLTRRREAEKKLFLTA